MNRVDFMQELERLLMDISESDRLDAIAYYNDYFDEAGVDNESQVIHELGSPQKVAGVIKENINIPVKQKKQTRNFPLALLIILIVFASPLLVGVGGGVVGLTIGVLAAIFSLIVAGIVVVLAVGVSMLACGIACTLVGAVCIVVGLMRIISSGMEGLILIGAGGISFAIGILFTIFFVWCVFKWLPTLFGWTIDLIRRLFSRKGRRNKA